MAFELEQLAKKLDSSSTSGFEIERIANSFGEASFGFELERITNAVENGAGSGDNKKIAMYDSVLAGTVSYFNDDIDYIGPLAFMGCTYLTEIWLPKVKTIDVGALAIENTASIYMFGDKVPELINSIGEEAQGLPYFGECTIYVKESMYSAFLSAPIWSEHDPSIFVPMTDEDIENLINQKEINDPSLTSVTDGMFANKISLERAYIPNATTIGEEAFMNCTSLSTVDITSATTIGNGAFSACSSLENISMPNVTSIGNAAFASCSSLTYVDILLDVSTIGMGAFMGCGLSEIILPTIEDIGDHAFLNCKNLMSVYVITNSVPTLGSYAVQPPTKIYVRESLYEEFLSAPNWSTIGSSWIIPMTGVEIESIYGTLI